MMHDQDNPPDMEVLTRSLPPESKVTLQLALCVVLCVLILVAFVAAVLRVDNAPFWSILSGAMGGILGLLTGGSSSKTR